MAGSSGIGASFKKAFRVWFGRPGASLRFLLIEICMVLATLSPLLFLFSEKLKVLAVLVVPFWLFLMLWARVNAAAAMQDALRDGSLFSFRLVDPSRYGAKLVYGLKRCVLLLLWGAPLIACGVIAWTHYAGEMDAFTLLRQIKSFGGGDLMTGGIYLLLIFAGALLIFIFGCAFHSADRHAFVLGEKSLGHHGKVLLCWLCALITLLPLLIALGILIARYAPLMQDLDLLIMGKAELPATKDSLIIFGVGALLTVPLLPLRSLVIAAHAAGLKKD